MNALTHKLPDRPGLWRIDGVEIDIYELDPVGGTLCFWGPDIGITYSGAVETQGVWSNDEWQGHIPAQFYDDQGPWTFVK